MYRLLFFITSILWVFGLHAQSPLSISFIHIGLDKGLSQSTVLDIAQDNQSNMWIATQNGLNRYNGYNFKVYQHDALDPNSIGSDIIRTCTTDSKGQLWVGTEEGFSMYKVNSDLFENFHCYENGEKLPINEIVEVNDSLLLLHVRKNKLLLFNSVTRQYTKQGVLPALLDLIPTALYRQKNLIYIGSQEGLFVYSIADRTLNRLAQESLKNKDIYTILEQSPTQIWLGTEGSGLLCVNPLTNELTSYLHRPNDPYSLSSNYIRALALDAQHRLWIGTLNSLNIYQEKENRFSVHRSDPHESGTLSQASVRDVFMDNQGGMWLGTYFGGLNYYHPFKDRFYNLQSTVKSNSLNCNIIGCIQEDTSGRIWIGTNSGGVNCYDPATRSFQHYTQKQGLGSNDVKVIHVNKTNGLIYIGTHTGGLSILEPKTGHMETIYTPETNNIYTFEPTESGEFWISGISSLLRFNPENKKITPIHTLRDGTPFLNKKITAIVRDSKRRLWLIGEKGLDTYLEEEGGLSLCSVLPSEFSKGHKMVNCVYESVRSGVFWIGTRNGLYRFTELTKEIKLYTTAQGLPNNIVHGIMEDSFGNLWLSTDKGLSRFQPSSEKFRNYTDSDGIQSNQFTNNAFYHAKDGMMYFGGINGITAFRPEQLPDNPYTPPVLLTRFTLFNQLVSVGDNTGILEQNISQTNHITLTARQSMFAIEFAVPNYISGSHNTFAYKLDGYDKEWYYSETSNVASYSNLPQGTYRFWVKAANSDGRWNELPTELWITILPVWYKTWWATFLFISFFIATVIFVFYYFWMRKSMKAQIELELIDKNRQKELNEMKLQFFINISHELRTPLTLIVAPLQEVLDKVSDRWVQLQLRHVQRNTNRLLHLINQLMDYRRAELGVFELHVKPHDVHEMVKKSFLIYERVARNQRVSYNFYSEVEDRMLWCDANYVELIVHNLLSNAFKYTNEGGSIQLSLKEENNGLSIEVKDTGRGIPIQKQRMIFDRFYQVDNTQAGSGIGLSLVHRLVELHHGEIRLESTEGIGSTFFVCLPINKEAYQPNELESPSNQVQEQAMYTKHNEAVFTAHEEDITEVEEAPLVLNDNREIILVVEDQADIRQYLCKELGPTYLMLEAENGEEALAILKNQEVSLILTDVMMPVMDGLKLCKYIKQNLYTCHIPVVMLSAKADVKEQLDGLQVGADDYLAKPFSMAVLTAKIKNLFRTRHSVIEHYSNSSEIEPEKVALNSLDEELLKKAMAVVERNIDNVEFSTYEFAREMCMSRSSLHLKLKALTGGTTNEFIQKIRFNRACKLLKEERYTVSEISSFVGFNTPSYFTSCFKKHIGCLPSEYLKKE